MRVESKAEGKGIKEVKGDVTIESLADGNNIKKMRIGEIEKKHGFKFGHIKFWIP